MVEYLSEPFTVGEVLLLLVIGILLLREVGAR